MKTRTFLNIKLTTALIVISLLFSCSKGDESITTPKTETKSETGFGGWSEPITISNGSFGATNSGYGFYLSDSPNRLDAGALLSYDAENNLNTPSKLVDLTNSASDYETYSALKSKMNGLTPNENETGYTIFLNEGRLVSSTEDIYGVTDSYKNTTKMYIGAYKASDKTYYLLEIQENSHQKYHTSQASKITIEPYTQNTSIIYRVKALDVQEEESVDGEINVVSKEKTVEN